MNCNGDSFEACLSRLLASIGSPTVSETFCRFVFEIEQSAMCQFAPEFTDVPATFPMINPIVSVPEAPNVFTTNVIGSQDETNLLSDDDDDEGTASLDELTAPKVRVEKNTNTKKQKKVESKVHKGHGKDISLFSNNIINAKQTKSRQEDDDDEDYDSDDMSWDGFEERSSKKGSKRRRVRPSVYDMSPKEMVKHQERGLQRHYKGRVMKIIKQCFGMRGKLNFKRGEEFGQTVAQVLGVKNNQWRKWWSDERVYWFSDHHHKLRDNKEIKAAVEQWKSQGHPRSSKTK
jgi:hypothetical protein